MFPEEFSPPKLLLDLIESGTWPAEGTSLFEIEKSSKIRGDLVSSAFPDSLGAKLVVLYPPPFILVSEEAAYNSEFWRDTVKNQDQLPYEYLVMIGDFGIGSDAPIVLNYFSDNGPSVWWLKWYFAEDTAATKWVKSHDSFDEFAISLNINRGT